MTYYNLISENDESTVVAQYESSQIVSEQKHLTEKMLEDRFVAQLQRQGYEWLNISTEAELIANLRRQVERLNDVIFTDSEWHRLFTTFIAKANGGVVEKTQLIQEDPRFSFNFDNGEMKNISLIDKQHIHQNHLQVIRQYTPTGGTAQNRYDVTILVNGLPMVHVELKRPGVDIREAFNQIKRYNRESFWADSGLFEYVQLYVISNGTYTKYYSNTTRALYLKEADQQQQKGRVVSNSFEYTIWWSDAKNHPIQLLQDFACTFFMKHTLLNVLTRFCVFNVEKNLMVMRPYQIAATERILERIKLAYNQKWFGSKDAGGYVWHTTGSGKTLTSFKTAQLATRLPFIDKVMFVVDRKDLDYQTMQEYDKFQKNAVNGSKNVAELESRLSDPTSRIIVTTIQKLSILVKRHKDLPIYNQHVVMIFDECHRSQFGEMHAAITKAFKKYYIFGFTGTPIFADNANMGGRPGENTTEQLFGMRLHSYTITDAIADKTVLPFRIEYVKTMRAKEGMEDAAVLDIDRERVMKDPRYISNIVEYILTHFEQKTLRNKNYQTEDQRLNGFNSMFATSSIEMAKLYYREFKRQMELLPEGKRLKVAMIYSYGANEEDPTDGELFEENPEDTTALSQTDKDALQECIDDYNKMFGSRYDLSSGGFQKYYKDVSKRMKKRELDLLIVVNMFLTGFDAKTLNTLWVDKNLKMHGLIQAFSRTNRILNSVKSFGNIVCFRNLQKEANDALGLFGNPDAAGMVFLKAFEEYYNGYEDEEGKEHPGYKEQVEKLLELFPIGEPVVGEDAKKEFIRIFSYILKLRNILSVFDEFEENQILGEEQMQHYRSMYIDFYHEFRSNHQGDAAVVNDDIEFEMELVKQDEMGIDRILQLVRDYAEENMLDAEIAIKLRKAINASPDLRNKRDLILQFIEKMAGGDNVEESWTEHVKEQSEAELQQIIDEEHLKPRETKNFLDMAFRNGYISMIGLAFTQILPPMSRFGRNNKTEETRQRVFGKLNAYFEKYKDIINLEE